MLNVYSNRLVEAYLPPTSMALGGLLGAISMDQAAFENLISGIASDDRAIRESSAEATCKLCLSKEIQDFEWPASLYDSLWQALHACWKESSSVFVKDEMSFIWKVEKLLWGILSIIQRFPEFDLAAAAASPSLSAEAVQALFARMLICSNLIAPQQCMHWIYQNRIDFRVIMRRSICSALLSEGQAGSGARKARHKDGGTSRDHVAPLLEVLQCIINGFSSPLDRAHRGLLLRVLMPLHQPNEMVEWRDQVPVLQLYHPQLVRCLKALIEKSDRIESAVNHANGSTPSSSTDVTRESGYQDPRSRVIPHQSPRSLLPAVIKNLLSYWPLPHAANTPKEVLMLHELEALVVMAAPTPSTHSSSASSSSSPSTQSDADLLEILALFLKRIVLSLGHGGDSDNFRTTQRALQMFKNKQILQLLSSQHIREDTGSGSVGTARSPLPSTSSPSSTSSSSVLCTSLSALIPALYKGGKLSWNPTVNKMTALALRGLRDLDPGLFERTADRLIRPDKGGGGGGSSRERAAGGGGVGKESAKVRAAGTVPQSTPSSGGNDDLDPLSLKSQSQLLMLSPQLLQPHIAKKMKPPVPVSFPQSGISMTQGPCPSLSSARMRDGSGAVSYPLGVTGVAPWAFPNPAVFPYTTDSNTDPTANSGVSDCSTVRRATNGISGAPTTVNISTAARRMPVSLKAMQFDVATRMPQSPPTAPPLGSERKGIQESDPRSLRTAAIPSLSEGDEESEGEEREEGPSSLRGYRCLVEYMDRCLPPLTDTDSSKETDWRGVQAAPTPTLLPALRFHDLVFGHELGRGSFGVVKYARMIARGKPRSEWPEYAVKVVSADTMAREGYSKGALREMAVLQTVGHPGFARLISSFRYTHSAYLVLEYAGGGDLHSLIIRVSGRRGPVSHPLTHLCARFVLGEVSAALLSLHDMGLAYNDLKPENVLITDVGHVKIADFGACRPVTPSAVEVLEGGLRGLAGGGALRNGDWKDPGPEIPALESKEDYSDCDVIDNRIEGTPAYMPPELLRGGYTLEGRGLEYLPDSWALGCVASFCLTGRPLYMGTAEEVLRQLDAEEHRDQTVKFDLKDSSRLAGSASQGAFCSEAEEQSAQAFIASLLDRDPAHRMSMRETVTHPYLVRGCATPSDGTSPPIMDPLTLHLSPPVTLPARSSDESFDEPTHSGSGSGSSLGSGEDGLWARRQFSVLWAPMPATYTASSEGSADPLKGPGDALYPLHDMQETEEERCATFCA